METEISEEVDKMLGLLDLKRILIKRFRNYCKSFYSTEVDNSIYPIASNIEIDKCIDEYLSKVSFTRFEGDTLDRERVREIIGK